MIKARQSKINTQIDQFQYWCNQKNKKDQKANGYGKRFCTCNTNKVNPSPYKKKWSKQKREEWGGTNMKPKRGKKISNTKQFHKIKTERKRSYSFVFEEAVRGWEKWRMWEGEEEEEQETMRGTERETEERIANNLGLNLF